MNFTSSLETSWIELKTPYLEEYGFNIIPSKG